MVRMEGKRVRGRPGKGRKSNRIAGGKEERERDREVSQCGEGSKSRLREA